MKALDTLGARASNAGDDFHELWALRHALSLLDHDSELKCITVEGLQTQDEHGVPVGTWDGVDCTFYYGGHDLAGAQRVVVDQCKYSTANPDQEWTVARLVATTNTRKDNSIIAKLAKAYKALAGKAPTLAADNSINVRLVSNQPVAEKLLKALAGNATQAADRKKLQGASKLDATDFSAFAAALDLSQCGASSRMSLERGLLQTISNWSDGDASGCVNGLRGHIRKNMMMPEGKYAFIDKERILAWMGVASTAALFPCPSSLHRVQNLIPREAVKALASQLAKSDSLVCLHGEGGCGKTSALQELETLLPTQSQLLVFDCYGAGQYMDPSAYRHRSQDAFLQLANELATKLRIPSLIPSSSSGDFPKMFRRRLEMAAEALRALDAEALLVVAIDAADNSIVAAQSRNPVEKSFVNELVDFTKLPGNVRLLLSTRSGHVSSLRLPKGTPEIEIKGFTAPETDINVRRVFAAATQSWCDDFHKYSRGNARVQQYAFEYAGKAPETALEYLLPNGKSLNDVFRRRLDEARTRQGNNQRVDVFCAAVSTLPRPIPISSLATVTGLTEMAIRDLISDFQPGVRLNAGKVTFADEDMEAFLREEATACLPEVRSKIAEHFSKERHASSYAASHVAEALFAVGNANAILELISADSSLAVIRDPVQRRSVQQQRLQIAMQVCRQTGNHVDTMLTVLIGAEAVKTDAALRDLLVENPDLAIQFSGDTTARLILHDADFAKNHGSMLAQQMAFNSRACDFISVRESSRHFNAWLTRRKEDCEQQQKRYPHSTAQPWKIEHGDIAAIIEAELRTYGPQRAVDLLRERVGLRVQCSIVLRLTTTLVAKGEAALVGQCLEYIPAEWRFLLLLPLGVASGKPDLLGLEACLGSKLIRRLVRINFLQRSWDDGQPTHLFLEAVLSTCELSLAHGGSTVLGMSMLQALSHPAARKRDVLFPSRTALIDITLRAVALLRIHDGHKLDLVDYLLDAEKPAASAQKDKDADKQRRWDAERKKKLEDFLAPLLPIYAERAKVLTGKVTTSKAITALGTVIAHYWRESYRFSRDYEAARMRSPMALSICGLMVAPGVDRAGLMDCADAMMKEKQQTASSPNVAVLTRFRLDLGLHDRIYALVENQVDLVKSARISATEKKDTLIELCRLLLPIRPSDAQSIFNATVEILSELDTEVFDQLTMLAPLAARARGAMSAATKLDTGGNLAIIAGDAGVRLADHDHFPWTDVAKAVTTLHFPLGLAAASRWADGELVGLRTMLPDVLEAGLAIGSLSAMQVTALFPLLDQVDQKLINTIVQKGKATLDAAQRQTLTEELARQELLRFGQGRRSGVAQYLAELQSGAMPGYRMKELARATAFCATHPVLRERAYDSATSSEPRKKTDDPMQCVQWQDHRFITAAEIVEVLARVKAYALKIKEFVASSSVLEKIRDTVKPQDYRDHLVALRNVESDELSGWDISEAFNQRLDSWKSIAVSDWCREELLGVLIRYLPSFSRELPYRPTPLTDLLKRTEKNEVQIFSALMEGIERHANNASGSSLFALIAFSAGYAAPADAEQVLKRYARRLVDRIPAEQRDAWVPDQIPSETSPALARFLYALMGDVDLRTRWRAAHAARVMARLGEHVVLDHMLALWESNSAVNYRDPSAPFYWLAARLWLVVTLDRIAGEQPDAISTHGSKLFAIATDINFPHLLVCEFAKSAVRKLLISGVFHLDDVQREGLSAVNTSVLAPEEIVREDRHGFDKYRFKDSEERRFRFDSMDTLPYWYSTPLELFSDLGQHAFLDEAERWIMDRWGASADQWEWEKEPRKARFSDGDYSLKSHGHGTLPTIERYSTHLEWHAMWCAAGNLLTSHPLRFVEADDPDDLRSWIEGSQLCNTDWWGADLRGGTPLSDQFWVVPPFEEERWLKDFSQDDFLAELSLQEVSSNLLVRSSHTTRSSKFSVSVKVESALVSSATGSALVRALQSATDSSSYRLPPTGDSLEIDAAPYRLLGWLSERHSEQELERSDPLCWGRRSLDKFPSAETVATLDLALQQGSETTWRHIATNQPVMRYQFWANYDDRDSDHRRYSETVDTSGYRLGITRLALQQFLEQREMDLIVEVEITRNNAPDQNADYEERKSHEARQHRIFLVRRSGAIESSEGRIGTWKASG